MHIQLKRTSSWVITLYWAPISADGWFCAWKQKHSYYRKGFVARALWLGLAVRWGYSRFPIIHYPWIEELYDCPNDPTPQGGWD